MSESGCYDYLFYDAPEVTQIFAFRNPWQRRKRPAMLMIAPKNQPHNGGLLDCVELLHQLGEERLAGFVKQGPPGFLAILRMHDFHAVRPLSRPIVRDFEGAEHVLLALQPFPSQQRRRSYGVVPEFRCGYSECYELVPSRRGCFTHGLARRASF